MGVYVDTYGRGAIIDKHTPNPNIRSPGGAWNQWYYCRYCKKHIENGTLRHGKIYCNLRHALLGALMGDHK